MGAGRGQGGGNVVRLKIGDRVLAGRAGEEVQELRAYVWGGAS